MIQFLMAGALFLLAVVRIPALLKNGRDPVLLASVFAGLSSILGNPVVYLALDPLFGGFNLVKLAVNTLMILGLWYLRNAVVEAISQSTDKRSWWVRNRPLAVTLLLQTVFFILASPKPTSTTWGEYHLFPFAALFSLMLVAFLGWASANIAAASIRFVPQMRKSFRIGFSMVGLGSAISALAMVIMGINLLSAIPGVGHFSFENAPYTLMEMIAIVLVSVGLTIPAIAGRAARKRRALHLQLTIDKVEPIRRKALENADMGRLLTADPAALPQDRLHRMIVEIWDAELAAGDESVLTLDDRSYLLEIERKLDLEHAD
jgi:hypothetical protein